MPSDAEVEEALRSAGVIRKKEAPPAALPVPEEPPAEPEGESANGRRGSERGRRMRRPSQEDAELAAGAHSPDGETRILRGDGSFRGDKAINTSFASGTTSKDEDSSSASKPSDQPSEGGEQTVLQVAAAEAPA